MTPVRRLGSALLLLLPLAGCRPPATRVFEVRFLPDVTYLESKHLKLDLHLPVLSRRDSPAPALVWIHGRGSDKGYARGQACCRFLASAGYACASIDYGDPAHSPEPLTPPDRRTYVQEARNAVRFLRLHAAEYGLDPARIAVAGQSRGGNLALLVALSTKDPEYSPAEPYPGVSDQVSAVVDFYGPVGGVIGPGGELGPDSPPVLIIHGTADATVPVRVSIELASELEALAVPHWLILEDGAGHGFDFTATGRQSQPLAIDLRAPVLNFLRQYLGPPPKALHWFYGAEGWAIASSSAVSSWCASKGFESTVVAPKTLAVRRQYSWLRK